MNIIIDLSPGPSSPCLEVACHVVNQTSAGVHNDYVESTRCKVRADNNIKVQQYVCSNSSNLRKWGKCNL